METPNLDKLEKLLVEEQKILNKDEFIIRIINRRNLQIIRATKKDLNKK